MAFALKPLNIPITAENKFSSIFKTLKSDVAGATKNVGKFNTKLKKTSAALAQKGQSLKKTGSSMIGVGKAMLGVTAIVVGLGYASVRAFQDLENGMQSVASLGVGENRIKELTKDVGILTVEVGKSTTDITEGLYQVVSAFGDTADSAQILRTNARAAAAGLATTQDAINLTSAVTKAYGDTSAEAVQKVADLAFQTVKLGQTTFPELAASIGAVTPLTKELAVSQEQLFGVMATATGVTGNTAEVATQMKGVMSALMSPTKTMTKLYKQLGVAGGKELIAKTGGIAETMKLLVDTAKKTKTPLKDYIGSIRGQTLALAMAGPQYDNLIKKTAEMAKSAGAADAAFAEQSKTFSFKLAQLRELVNNNLADIGAIIVPILLDIMKEITPLIKKFGNLSPEVKKFIVIGAGLAAALAPVIIGLGMVVSAVGSIMSALSVALPVISTVISFFGSFGSILAALPALFNPVTIAIGLFTAAFTLSIILFKKFFTNIQNSKIAPQWIKDFATDWLNGLELMKEGFSNFGSFVGDIFKGVWEGMKKGIDLYLEFLLKAVKKVSNVVPDWIKESVGIDIGTETTGETPTSTVTSESIKEMQTQYMMTKYSVEQQNVNVNFGNTPQGTTVESEGGDIAQLNMGFAQ